MKQYDACSGCGICTMVCPAWWETRDVWFTPHGRARAVQGGASAEQMAESIASCRLCGACEPVCPEEIDIIGMERRLRVQLHEGGRTLFTQEAVSVPSVSIDPGLDRSTGRLLLAGPVLESMPALLNRVVDRLGGAGRVGVARDDGRDLALAYETGAPLDEGRVERFLSSIRAAREVVAVEGVLHRLLRERCPGVPVRGLAEALLNGKVNIPELGPRDLFVSDPRSYHANHPELVRLFSRLRLETGCQMNLDLQRMAIPTCADSIQAREENDSTCDVAVAWMLEGRDIDRIVVESPADYDALDNRTDLPVMHLATLLTEARKS
jgi:ferredoxin